MILPYIDANSDFPDVKTALTEPDGLLCIGADLSANRLVNAYNHGIFPWYSTGEPIMWWSPSERMVLLPEQLHLSKSLKKALKKQQPEFIHNRNFETIIKHCASVSRKDHGTWIHPEMITAYINLFKAGNGFCLEVEIDGQLVGGIYGVKVNNILCGESMFSLSSNGSKYALYGLCQYMQRNNIELLDCQLHNDHLESMGAALISRQQFQQYLPKATD